MPIYEYVCVNGHRFELLQNIGEKSPEKCEICSASVKKVISNFSMKKGAGMWLYNRQTGKKVTPR